MKGPKLAETWVILNQSCKKVNIYLWIRQLRIVNTSACMPACLLTPVASYITIRLKPKQIGNNASATPWQSATEVVIAVHKAEWEDGIPPEEQNILKFHLLSTQKSNNTLIDWAKKHANNPLINVGFAANVATMGLNRSLAVDCTVNRAIPTPPLCKNCVFVLAPPVISSITTGSFKKEPQLNFAVFAVKFFTLCKTGTNNEKGFKGSLIGSLHDTQIALLGGFGFALKNDEENKEIALWYGLFLGLKIFWLKDGDEKGLIAADFMSENCKIFSILYKNFLGFYQVWELIDKKWKREVVSGRTNRTSVRIRIEQICTTPELLRIWGVLNHEYMFCETWNQFLHHVSLGICHMACLE